MDISTEMTIEMMKITNRIGELTAENKGLKEHIKLLEKNRDGFEAVAAKYSKLLEKLCDETDK